MSQQWQDILKTVKGHPRTVKAKLTVSEIQRVITQCELDARYQFPDEYRTWLQQFDVAEIGGCFIFGVGGEGNLEEQQSEYIHKGWINVANDGCGNYFILVLSKEFSLDAPVIFLDAYQKPDKAYIVASDFSMFVQSRLKDDGIEESSEPPWLFIREEALSFDLRLELAKNINLPWELV